MVGVAPLAVIPRARGGLIGVEQGPAAPQVLGCAVLGEVAIHSGAGDPQHFRDVGGRDAPVAEIARLGGIGVVALAGRPNRVVDRDSLFLPLLVKRAVGLAIRGQRVPP
jgi:hypothetical protein